MTHDEFVKSLRELADFYEAHPGLKPPGNMSQGVFTIFPSGKDEMAVHARELGTCEKQVTETMFYLIRKKPIGLFTLQAAEWRSTLCERVVVGTETVPEQVVEAKVIPAYEREIVEWRCPESILDG